MKRLFYSILIFSCLFCILLTGCNLIISLFDGMEGYELKIDPENTQVNLGDSIYYHLNKVNNSTGECKDISNEAEWVSSDRSIVTISTSGYVETYKVGSVTITAHYEDESASTDLTILPEPEPTPVSGMTAEYKFDTNCLDSSGNELDGEGYSISFVTDRHGKDYSAIYFNGSDAFVETPITWDYSLSFTISVWVNVDTFEETGITIIGNVHLVDGANWNGFWIDFRQPNNQLRFYHNEDSFFYEPTPSFTVDTWYHIVYSYNDYAQTLSLYMNSVLINTEYMTYSNFTDTSPTYIGAIGNYNSDIFLFHGTMDDMLIFERSLTQEEVEYIFNSQS